MATRWVYCPIVGQHLVGAPEGALDVQDPPRVEEPVDHRLKDSRVGEIHLVRTSSNQADVVFSYSLLPVVVGAGGPGRMQAALGTSSIGAYYNPWTALVTIWIYLQQPESLAIPGSALVRFLVNGATGEVLNQDVTDYSQLEQYDLDQIYRDHTQATDSTQTAPIQQHYQTRSVFIDPNDDRVYVGNTVWQYDQTLDWVGRPVSAHFDPGTNLPTLRDLFHKVVAAPNPGDIIGMRYDDTTQLETLLKYTLVDDEYMPAYHAGPQVQNPKIRSGTSIEEIDGNLHAALSQPYAARVLRYDMTHSCSW